MKPSMLTDYFKRIVKPGEGNVSPRNTKGKDTKARGGEKGERKETRRARLRIIAEETLNALEKGHYTIENTPYDLAGPVEDVIKRTAYFDPDCFLSDWSTSTPSRSYSQCTITVEEITTLTAACQLFSSRDSLGIQKIGILNFASAKKEGGGFINGASAQEESIARASTLYPSLMSNEGQRFYKLNRADNRGCYYTHAMLYSPDVLVIRDDDAKAAKWHPPVTVDVVTSPAVNAGVVLGKIKDSSRIEKEREKINEVMVERMARILFLLEHKGADVIVLGSFGTGVFRNDVNAVANIWKQLIGPGGRFSRSFSRIVFAVIPNETYQDYARTFIDLVEEST